MSSFNPYDDTQKILKASSIFTPPDINGMLGRGSYGTVRICRIFDSPSFMAVKCLPLIEHQNGANRDKIMDEVKALRQARHKNIIEFHNITIWSGSLGILTEYVNGGSLDTLLFSKTNIDIPSSLKCRIATQLGDAINFLHNVCPRPFVHGDIKPDNILLTENLTVKLADFGSINITACTGATRTIDQRQWNKQYTPIFSAPEILKNPECPRRKDMDVYSYGMVLYEIVTRTRVYGNAALRQACLIQIIKDMGQRPNKEPIDAARKRLKHNEENTFNTLVHVMKQCWNTMKQRRPKMSEDHRCHQQRIYEMCDTLHAELKRIMKEENIELQVSKLLPITKQKDQKYFNEKVWITLDKFINPFEEIALSNGSESAELKEEDIGKVRVVDCFRKWSLAKKRGFFKLEKEATNIIKEKFEAAIENEHFIKLSIDEMEALLKIDSLKIASEEVMYRAMMRWIQHQPRNNAQQHIFVLFRLVKIGKLSRQFLIDVVANEKLIMNSKECMNALLQAVLPRVDAGMPNNELREAGKSLVAFDGKSNILIYDISIRKVVQTSTTKFHSDHSLGSVVKLNGLIYVISGADKQVERFELEPTSAESIAPVNHMRNYAASTVCKEYIYTTGGGSHIRNFASGERYNYKKNHWESIKSMQQARSGHALVAHKGLVYALGGWGMNSVERYDPHADAWSSIPKMHVKRYWPATVVLNDEIYAIGGWNQEQEDTSSVEKYNASKHAWVVVASLKEARYRPAACVFNEKIYVIGGNSNIVEAYDPKRNTWTVHANVEDLRSVINVTTK